MSPLLDKNQPSRIMVENNTGITIPAMKAVTFDSNGTSYPAIALANSTTNPVLGITSSPILPGAVGIITTLGYIFDINTTPWAEKTILYANALGVLSSTPTIIGDAAVAVVFKQGILGTLFVLALSTQYDLPSTGTVTQDNFSYKTIAINKTVLIPEDQQMAVFEGINIDGTLNIDGQLILED